jgi:UDP-glucuronate 4-epimerase
MSGVTLVTGAAGFIGYHVADALLSRGDAVLGIDNLNDYYDPALKRARLERLQARPRFSFAQVDIAEHQALDAALDGVQVDAVVHLAAQAGVRYSFTNPRAYADSNVTGFLNLLEAARARPPRHFVYASSSSVYGANTTQLFSVSDRVDHPVSLYAATKRANELMAEVYARQFALPLTGLRFFTVYGPWGRPDMAAMKFTRAILAGQPIDVYNNGDLQRDFTYIDDIVDGVLRIFDRLPAAEGVVPHRLFNIGNHRPEPLLRFIEVLASALGAKPSMNLLPMQPGDVYSTYADISEIQQEYGWAPTTTIEQGLPNLVSWYRDFYEP